MWWMKYKLLKNKIADDKFEKQLATESSRAEQEQPASEADLYEDYRNETEIDA